MYCDSSNCSECEPLRKRLDFLEWLILNPNAKPTVGGWMFSVDTNTEGPFVNLDMRHRDGRFVLRQVDVMRRERPEATLAFDAAQFIREEYPAEAD